MDIKYAMFFALLLAVPMAYANPGNMPTQMLSDALTHVQCKMTFSTGIVGLLQSNSPSASSISTSALQADVQKLQTDASNGDVTSFRGDVATFDSDLQSLNGAIKSWRGESGKNLTNSSRQTIKSGDTQLRTTLETCTDNALKTFADEKLLGYNTDLADMQAKIANLSAKGVDTSALSSLVSDAQSTIVSPFQSAINSATNASQLRDAIEQYCLYDGCKSGTNFHLAAKWDIAKTSAVESYLQSKPNAGNFTSQFSQVTSDVSQSQSALSSVGTSAYGPGQSDSVFNPLKDASDVLKQIASGMRS